MFAFFSKLVNRFAIWVLVAAVLLVGAAAFVAPKLMPLLAEDGFAPAGVESTLADNKVADTFAKDRPELIVILKSKTNADMRSSSVKAAVDNVAEQFKRDASVTSVNTFFTTGQNDLISKDHQSSLALVDIKGDKKNVQEVSARLRDTVKSDDFTLAYGGAGILNHDVTQQIDSDLRVAETVSFALLGILLVIVFRGVVAAVLPLLLGGFTVLVAFLVLRGLVEFTTMVQYALNVIILIGLGLAVDYSLLLVSRFREELLAQKGNVGEALRVTMHTAGRTIFFSGMTVIISLLSLLIFPIDFLRSMGLGGASAVLVAMVGALLVLPAMLRLLGRRVNWLSFGKARRMDQAMLQGGTHEEGDSIWHKTGAVFMRSPVVTILAVLALLLFVGTPFLRAKFTTPDESVLPPSSIARQATEQLKRDFTFSQTPIRVVYTTNQSAITDVKAVSDLYDYAQQLKKLPNVEGVESVVNLPGQQLSKAQTVQLLTHVNMAPTAVQAAIRPMIDGKTTVLNVSFTSPTMGSDTQDLVKTIRTQGAPNAQIQVGGLTADLVDLLATLIKYIPYAAATIAVTLVVLLFLMLGSVVLPLVAMVQNVLSLTASFGALVWIFQEGNLTDLLHMSQAGSIDATQPVLVFAVAFGLSMDYSVFLYGRIKEEHDRTGGDTPQAVLGGLQKTGTIITSAALLLFVVVAAFATSRISIMQQVGTGLAVAVLVDAFVVRMVLVPATMKLLGRANWWAPAFMRRLQAKIGLSD